jgi:ABC-type multidrug transport system fused ATPase/permease subunit
LFSLTRARKSWLRWRSGWSSWLQAAAKLLPLVQRRKAQLLIAFACGLGYALIGLLEPWLLKLILDNVVLGKPLPRFLQPLFDDPAALRLQLLNVLVIVLVLVAAVRGVFYYYQQLLSARVGQQTAANLRLALYSHLQRLSLSFHTRRRTGDILTRLTNDIRQLRDIFIALPLSIASEFFMVAGMAIIMFALDWSLTLVALLVLPSMALLLAAYQRPMKQAIREQREREGHLATIAAEVLGAIRVVQGFRREPYEIERFGSQNKRSVRVGLKAARLEAKLRWLAEVAVAVVTALVLAVATRRVLRGDISPGDLLVFVAYLRTFNRPLRRISRMAERGARGAASAERVLELLAVEPGVADRPGAVRAPRARHELAFDNVSFQHRRGVPVLSRISLRIRQGERIALVGPTGAGKSTLVSLIARFFDPTEGSVTIDGRDLREFTLDSVRRQVAFVFQEPVLFAATIAENIGYGKPEATRAEIEAAAQGAGIDEIIRALPEGYETVIGERGETLSGGQRQCVSIARALITDAPIVVLDEPTTGLDPQSALLVLQALERLMQGRTVITITHQIQNIQGADRILLLENGRIREVGAGVPVQVELNA